MTHARAKITTEYRLTPRPCKRCKRWMSREFLEEHLKEMTRIKGDKISKAHKDNKHGKKIYQSDRIIELRKQGLSIRKIAKIIGCSTSPVVEALKVGRSSQIAEDKK